MSLNPITIQTDKKDEVNLSMVIAFDYQNNVVCLSSCLDYVGINSTKVTVAHTLLEEEVDEIIAALQKMKQEFK